MAISTNAKRYPDESVLEFARWANQNTGGFMLVVSDIAPDYNWAAEHENPEEEHPDRVGLGFMHSGGLVLDWEVFFRGKHNREVDRLARKRVEALSGLFQEQGIEGEVVLWSELERKILEQSKENDVAGMLYFNNEWADLHAVIDRDRDMKRDVGNVHRRLASHVVERLAVQGKSEDFVHSAMQSYTAEEIFLSALLAQTGWASIKIGPQWERYYDEITLKYLSGEYLMSHLTDTGPSHAPFGAVYLEVQE